MQTRVCVRTKVFAKRESTKGAARSQIEVSAKFVHATASVLLKDKMGIGVGVSYANLELVTKRNENATKGRGRRPLNLYVWCFLYGVGNYESRLLKIGCRLACSREMMAWIRRLDLLERRR